MSVCLCSVRALSRGRTPNPKTLTPFLFQTATIQRRHPTSLRHAASEAYRPDGPVHDVPFEGEELPLTIGEFAVGRRSTVTGSEREAFAKLYKTVRKPEGHGYEEHELDQIADEYYEGEEEGDVDTIFQKVLAKKSPTARTLPKGKGTMEALARSILEPKNTAVTGEKRKKLEEVRLAEKERVKMLLEAAPSDQALWAVLDKEVFAVIRAMDLDAKTTFHDPIQGPSRRVPKPTPKQKRISARRSPAAKSTESEGEDAEILPTDPAVVHHLYPIHLLNAALTLRINFPASTLVFTILPTIKELGRSSYALGATTNLYKTVIRAAFRQSHSYAQICALLQDMDNGGIEYDKGVVLLLNDIITAHREAEYGRLGKDMRVLMQLQHFAEGVAQLQEWQTAIRRRLGDFTIDKGFPLIRRTQPWKDTMVGPEKAWHSGPMHRDHERKRRALRSKTGAPKERIDGRASFSKRVGRPSGNSRDPTDTDVPWNVTRVSIDRPKQDYRTVRHIALHVPGERQSADSGDSSAERKARPIQKEQPQKHRDTDADSFLKDIIEITANGPKRSDAFGDFQYPSARSVRLGKPSKPNAKVSRSLQGHG